MSHISAEIQAQPLTSAVPPHQRSRASGSTVDHRHASRSCWALGTSVWTRKGTDEPSLSRWLHMLQLSNPEKIWLMADTGLRSTAEVRVFEDRTSVCFRWSRCFPGSSCTTPSRWGATTTATTSTRESRSTSAPRRTTRGPSHITTAAACRSDLSRKQRLLKAWRRDSSDDRTAWKDGLASCVHSSVCVCLNVFRASGFSDYANKTSSLGVCVVHGNMGNVHIHCHSFGLDSQVFTGNRKLSPAIFSLA